MFDSIGPWAQTRKSTTDLKSSIIFKIHSFYCVNVPIEHTSLRVNVHFEIVSQNKQVSVVNET